MRAVRRVLGLVLEKKETHEQGRGYWSGKARKSCSPPQKACILLLLSLSQESEARQAEVAAVSRKSEATLAALRVDLEAQVKSHSPTAERFSFSARMRNHVYLQMCMYCPSTDM